MKENNNIPIKALFLIKKNSPEENNLGLDHSYLKLGRAKEIRKYSALLAKRIKYDLGHALRDNPSKWFVVSPLHNFPNNTQLLLSKRVAQNLRIPYLRLYGMSNLDKNHLNGRPRRKIFAEMATKEERLRTAGKLWKALNFNPVRGKNLIFVDDCFITGSVSETLISFMLKAGAIRVERYVIFCLDGRGDNTFEYHLDRMAIKQNDVQVLAKILNTKNTIYTTRLLTFTYRLTPKKFSQLLGCLNLNAKFNLYLSSLGYFDGLIFRSVKLCNPFFLKNIDTLANTLRKETNLNLPKSKLLMKISSRQFIQTIERGLEKYQHRVPVQEIKYILNHIQNALKKRVSH